MPATREADPSSIQAAAASHQQGHFDPEFFGNAILNDTSLVLATDLHLDGVHRRRVFLTGDQENWSYIAAMHPGGLGVDVLKAPHHGGSLFLEDSKEALARVYAWMRPRSVFVSGAAGDGLAGPACLDRRTSSCASRARGCGPATVISGVPVRAV
jgi:hypothetical protein